MSATRGTPPAVPSRPKKTPTTSDEPASSSTKSKPTDPQTPPRPRKKDDGTDPASPKQARLERKGSKKTKAEADEKKNPEEKTTDDEVTNGKQDGKEPKVQKRSSKVLNSEAKPTEQPASSSNKKSDKKPTKSSSSEAESESSTDSEPKTKPTKKPHKAPVKDESPEESSEKDSEEPSNGKVSPKVPREVKNTGKNLPEVEEESENSDDSAPAKPSKTPGKSPKPARKEPSGDSPSTDHASTIESEEIMPLPVTKPRSHSAAPEPIVRPDDSQDDKKKKKGGFFSFFRSKPKKDKHPSAGSANHGGTAPIHVREGTPDKRKTEEEKKTYVVSCVAELPEDWQKKLKKAHLEEDTLNAHFAVLCNVLHFLTKHSFRIPNQEKESRERRPYTSPEMMEAARLSMEVTDNIKKFYKNIEFSGKGGFGRVFAAKDIQTKKRIAIKKLPHATEKDKKSNYCEIAFLRTCNHPNIVKFLRSWDFSDKGEAWIVTEFLEGGTLSEAVKVHQFSERHIAYVAREILKALKYLHGMGYIHRDLKSGNVMMSIEGHIKLIDFGLCCDTTDGPRLQMLGSPFWIPPEMIRKQRHGCPADIWSFAVCVLEMYLKEPPNCESRLYAMFTAASAGLKSAIPARASDHARDFLSHCLELNPKKRWTAEQLLEHPFVTQPKLEEGIRDVLRGVFVSNSLALSGI